MLREANVQLYDSLPAEYFDADVSDHDEIEYKFSLSKASYERLLNLGSVRTERVLKMRNHYFDTRDFRLYSKKARLRFRITNRTDGEVTLKLPSSKVVSSQHPPKICREITAFASPEELYAMIEGERDIDLPKEIKSKLPVGQKKLLYLGQIKTKRTLLRLPNGLEIEVDKAKILDETIYEIEIEIGAGTNAEAIFDYVTRFLKLNDIENEPTEVSKSKRFFSKILSR
ncbi:MAG: CYTH domain-containing protein [Bdellovibrionales bacterium]|nr:CYTH domain-containing protein [Bdellovibrionales bacterium]